MLLAILVEDKLTRITALMLSIQILFLIIVLPIIIMFIIGLIRGIQLLIQWVGQRHRLKSTGVSPEMPGCPNCFYFVRGWETSICPECGTDIKGSNVRIGIDLDKRFKARAAFSIAILAVIFILLPFGGWLCEVNTITETWVFVSKGANTFEVRIEASRYQRRFPPKDESVVMLMVESKNAAEPDDFLDKSRKRIQQTKYWDSNGFRVLFFDNADEMNTDQEMSIYLGDAIEEDADSMKTHATEINKMLKHACNISDAQSPNLLPVTNLFQYSGSGSSFGNDHWPAGLALLVMASLLTVIMLPVYVVKRHKPGIRPVRNGEWLTSADPDCTTN